jgi:hypothetical protein
MTENNLSEKEEFIIKLGYELFNKIAAIGSKIRKDDHLRSGIRILLREITDTSNICMISIGKPLFIDEYLAGEKSTRAEMNEDFASQNSEDVRIFHFRGCVGITNNFRAYHASVSGLQPDEDVAVAIILLSRVCKMSIVEVMDRIKANGGELPASLSYEKHYLYKFLEQYK